MNAVEAGLLAKLNAASIAGQNGVFLHLATQGTALPYILMRPVTGISDGSNTRDMENYQYDVIAVGSIDASPAAAGTIANAIDTALDGQTITVSGYTLVGEVRRVRRVELRDAEAYYRGATYELTVSKAAP